MTINAVVSASSKLPITIMVILYFRANGALLLCAINNSNEKSQGDKNHIAIILKQEIDSKKIKRYLPRQYFLILKIYQI